MDHLTDSHRDFLTRNLPLIKDDHRFLGLAIGGSYITGEIDAFSDLDLYIVVDDYHHPHVMMEREEIVSHFGNLLCAHSGEHAREPEVFTCLYDHPMLRVDICFCTIEYFKHRRGEDPEILWERGHRLSRAFLSHPMPPARVDPQWLEDRFWVWIHYLTTKLARGELLEVVDGLSFLRLQVLAPLARFNEDLPPRGMRFLEKALPHQKAAFEQTVPKGCERNAIADALNACVDLYADLRDALPVGIHRRRKPEKAVRAFMESVDSGQTWAY